MQLLLFFLAFFQPVTNLETERLARFVVRVQPKAVFYARPLANNIFEQSGKHNLDPTVLAAVVWMESWFDHDARGSDYERGLWQIYPRASALGLFWEVARRGRAIPPRWNRPWFKLTIRERQAVSRDVELGTVLAVELLAVFIKHCRVKHDDHRRPTDSYAHYNSGFRWPRPGYSYKLWKRTKIIRKFLGRPVITNQEKVWLERMVK
jgi:hypothetical protein